ncbi:peptidase inhibitor I9 [Planifilum fimeticola]|uniref:Peptidase inhibitor I9 n=1 Tax=Planifilum fimeticola TaxID=201975 RepID=A0A2T0LEW4_9BACL|nr:S8 family serine peptidase [Planifilum fimeticola]PRX40707.1 peptidase inhibitor I9 [Planifilum fimeticola]
MRRQLRLLVVLCLSVFIVFSGMVSPALARVNPADAPEKGDSGGEDYYYVQLESPPVASYEGGIKGLEATQPEEGEKLNVQSAATRSYAEHLAEERQDYKEWMKKNAPKAKVVTEYQLTLNGLAVKADKATAKKLAEGPGVKKVVKSISYRPAMNTSHGIINDAPAWKAGYNGSGVKVAVIDTGIDPKHPFLTDPSLPVPEGYPEGDERFTSNKVIVARVYSPDVKGTPDDPTPEDLNGHGTHVAGTIAGVSGYADPQGRAKSPLSGVAPKAYLGNYNVFPCEDCSAESIYIAQAVEDAVRDGMDVANMSLGGTAEPGFDLLAEVVNAASDAGMTMVIAAGNEGPGPQTVASPGTADEAITVAAVSNGHFFGFPITVNLDGEEKVLPAGTSDPGGQVTSRVEAPLAVVPDDDGKACSGIAGDLTGKIAVIHRGDCTFTEKALAAQQRGAVGMILINNSPGDPTAMLVEEIVTIPVVMVSMEDGQAILEAQNASAVFEPRDMEEFETDNDRLIADFSSRGPTVNMTLKPDVAAVGVNVYSSVPGGDLASFNGTSMATPHVTGAAALLKQAHPDWTPREIKAALMGTAKDPASDPLPLEVGAGIIDVGAALKPVAMAEPASLSFKEVPLNSAKGKGKGKGKDAEVALQVTLKNTTGSNQVYRIAADDSKNVQVSKKTLPVQRGKTAQFTVTPLTKGKNAGQDVQGYIVIQAKDGKSIRIPYYFRVQ